MVPIDSGLPLEHLVVERFDYSPVSGEWNHWTELRLLVRLASEPAMPSRAHLVIAPDGPGAPVSATAETCAIERRLRNGGPAGFEVLWSATFSVPLEVVEASPALFTLLVGDRHPVAVTLPAPVRHDAFSPILSLRARPTKRPRSIRPRQVAAVATSVAVTATSIPAVALGTQVTTPTATSAPPSSGVATTSPTTPAPAAAPAATPVRHHATPVRHHAALSSHHTTPAGHHATPHNATGHSTSHRAVVVSRTPESAKHSSHPATHAAASASMSFGAPAAPGTTSTAAKETTSTTTTTPAATSTTTTTTSPAANPATTRPTTPVAPAQPGKPSVTPVTHHRAPAASHRTRHAARPSSGGAALGPTASSSTPAPSPGADSSTSTGTVSGLSSTPPGFSGPQSWTGTVAANPALTGAVTELSGLLSNGDRPPSFLIPIYMEAGRHYHVPWEVLAAINAIETDYGRNLNTSSAGAVGWMQFEPSTWAQYGMAVDGHSVPNPYDPRDAIFSAARYLAAAGAAQDVSRAVFAYNHASWYVDEVMSRARAIATHAQFERATAQHGKFAVYFADGHRPGAGGHRSALRVRYTSGVLSHYDRLIAAANMVSAANFPYLWGGGHTQPSRFGPFDCSGSVSYVMQQAGYRVPTSVSGDIPSWKFPAGPGRVTIFYNPTHTFMRIGNRYFGTSGFARPGGGAGWFDVDKLPASYLAQFNEVHVPNLGPDSFDGSQGPLVITPLFTRHRHRRATSTLSFLPLMSTLGPFPGTSALPALPQ